MILIWDDTKLKTLETGKCSAGVEGSQVKETVEWKCCVFSPAHVLIRKVSHFSGFLFIEVNFPGPNIDLYNWQNNAWRLPFFWISAMRIMCVCWYHRIKKMITQILANFPQTLFTPSKQALAISSSSVPSSGQHLKLHRMKNHFCLLAAFDR